MMRRKKRQQQRRRWLTRRASPKVTSPAAAAPSGKPGPVAPTRRPGRQLPPPGFGSLVQSVMTQIFYYLGELPASGGQAAMDLDLAKHHLDVLTVLEEKTKNNLSPEEQSMLDAALYETRTRFVNVASQLLGP